MRSRYRTAGLNGGLRSSTICSGERSRCGRRRRPRREDKRWVGGRRLRSRGCLQIGGMHLGCCITHGRGIWKVKRPSLVEFVGRRRVDQHMKANGCHFSQAALRHQNRMATQLNANDMEMPSISVAWRRDLKRSAIQDQVVGSYCRGSADGEN